MRIPIPARKLSSGAWLCIILFGFGSIVIGAFYFAARYFTTPHTTTAAFGIPSSSVRMVFLNVHGNESPGAEAIEVIRRVNPDFIFLQQARGKSIPALKRQLGQSLIERAYYPQQNLPDAGNEVGNIILSKYPLEDSRPIPNHMDGSCGLWASTIVDGKRFYVGCLSLSDELAQAGARQKEIAHFTSAWKSLQRPPVVVAVGSSMIVEDGAFQSSTDSTWALSPEWTGIASSAQGDVHVLELNTPQKE